MNRILLYLVVALIAFFAATTGSDVFAQMTLGHESVSQALSEHFYWARVELIGTLMLFLPFAFLAAIASWVEKRTKRLVGWTIFGLPTLLLVYSYFEGYRASKLAELDRHWTAATLDVGFLPFTGLAVVLLTCVAGFLLMVLQRKKGHPVQESS
jgi:hypothetical protein